MVLSSGSPDPISTAHSAEFDALIPTIVWAEPFEIRSPYSDGMDFSIEGLIWASAPRPCDLAFEVVAQYDGRTIPLGFATYGRAQSGQYGDRVVGEIEGAPPEQIDLVLRSSRAAAAQTLDMYEIWGGVLRITNVPVVRDRDDTVEQPKFRARLEE